MPEQEQEQDDSQPIAEQFDIYSSVEPAPEPEVEETHEEVEEVPKEEASEEVEEPVEEKGLDIDELAEKAADKLEQKAREAAAQNRQLTPEEINKIFRPFHVTPDVLKSLGFEDPTPEQQKGFQQFVNGVVQQAVFTAKYYADLQLEQLRKQAQPIWEQYESSLYEKQVNAFYNDFPELKAYDKVVGLVASKISPTKADGKPKSFREVADEIATSAKTMLTELGLDLSPKQPSKEETNHRAAPSAVPRMAQLGGAGRSLVNAGENKAPNEFSIYDR